MMAKEIQLCRSQVIFLPNSSLAATAGEIIAQSLYFSIKEPKSIFQGLIMYLYSIHQS